MIKCGLILCVCVCVTDHIFLLFKAPCSALWCWCLAACCRGDRWPQRGIMAPIAASFMWCKWTAASEGQEFWPSSTDLSSYNGSVGSPPPPPVGFHFLPFQPTYLGICLLMLLKCWLLFFFFIFWILDFYQNDRRGCRERRHTFLPSQFHFTTVGNSLHMGINCSGISEEGIGSSSCSPGF